MVLRFYPKMFLHVDSQQQSSWFENKYQIKYIKVDSILISFDQVESIVSSEKPQNSKKAPISFQHQVSKTLVVFKSYGVFRKHQLDYCQQ